MKQDTIVKIAVLALLFCGVGLATGACEMSCKSDGPNSAKDVVDEIGDEIEDVADEIKD